MEIKRLLQSQITLAGVDVFNPVPLTHLNLGLSIASQHRLYWMSYQIMTGGVYQITITITYKNIQILHYIYTLKHHITYDCSY